MSKTISYLLIVTTAPGQKRVLCLGTEQGNCFFTALLCSLSACPSQQHKTCTFGLNVPELWCQPAHTNHTALWLLSTSRGVWTPKAQIQKILPGPGTQLEFTDSMFLKHLSPSMVLSPTTSTCGYQPRKPHAMDIQCPSHHKTRIATHIAGHILCTMSQKSYEFHRLYYKSL